MTASDAVDSAYRQIAQRALGRNRERAAEVRGLLAEWQRTGRFAPGQRERARAAVHSLRGSAGTFGRAEVSVAAGELETTLDADMPASPGVVEALLCRIEQGLADEPASAT